MILLWLNCFKEVVTCIDSAAIVFCISCGKCTVFENVRVHSVDYEKAFLSKKLLLCQLFPTKHYTEMILTYHEMIDFMPDQ